MEYMRRPELQRTPVQVKTPENPAQIKPLVPTKPLKSRPKPVESAEQQAIRAYESVRSTPVLSGTSELQRKIQHQAQHKNALQRIKSLRQSTSKDNRIVRDELHNIRDAIQLRQDHQRSRVSAQTQDQAKQLEQRLRRPDVPLQVGKSPTLAGVAEHFIAQTEAMKTAREEQYNVIQRLKTAGKTLVAQAQVQRFPMPELASAIQRFSDPLENTAVRSSAFAALGMNPSMTLELQRALADNEANLELQRQAAALQAETPTGLSDKIAAQMSGGQPLPAHIQKQLELHFNTDLSKVRIHTDPTAHELSQKVSAVAFTTGQHIFFSKSTYNPDSSAGFELLAHEVAHTIQQGSGQVSAGIDSDPALEHAAQEQGKKAAENKGNLEQQAARQPASNNFQRFVGFPAPFRSAKDEQTIQDARTSTVENLTARGTHSAGWQALTEAVHGPQPAFPREANLQPHLEKDGAVQNKQSEGVYTANFQAPTTRVQRQANHTQFILQREPLPIQRFSIKGAISDFLGVIPGYKQICAVFGKDLVTGQAVQQNPNAILDALSDLVPGPIKDMVKALRESNAIPKAWAWFKAELGKINIGEAWQGIKDGLSSFSIWKMNVGEVKDKIKAAVMKPINQVKNLIVGSIRKLAEIALEAIGAAFGGSGKQLIDGLKNAGNVIIDVIKNPGKFIRNLVQALKGGVQNFATNAKTHMTNGLGQWLSGESGLAFPNNLDIKGVFTLALSVLGITYINFRKTLVAKLGEDKTKIAESKIDLVKNIAGKGMMAAEGMQSHEGTVKSEVIEGSKDFVKTSVIQAAVIKLARMFIPGGGLIQVFITGFDMVKFVINEGSRIASLVSSIMGGIANIASGNVGGAIAKVEQSLAKSIPLALSFLSRIFRVSGIGEKIKGIIQKVKTKIDAVVKKLMDKVAGLVAKMASGAQAGVSTVVTGAKNLLSGIFGKKTFVAGKENHSIWVDIKNNKAELWIASTPREAGQQLAELRKEATQKGVFGLIEPSWKVAQTAISTARGKLRDIANDPALTDEKRKERSADTQKRMTDIVNGVQHSVKDVFDQLEKNGGNTSNLQVNLDAKVLRAELWASGRPGWAKKTLEALIKDYPWAFESDGTIKQNAIGRPMYDRRHIVAFDKIIDTEVAQVNGKTMTQAATYLTGRGSKYTPKKNATNGTIDITSIKTSMKTLLAVEFNEITNLWVGDAAENQRIGREFAAAQQRRKATTPGTPEFEAESQKVATNQVDVPAGSSTGRSLNTAENQAIGEINNAVSIMPSIEANHAILTQMFLGQMPRTTLYTRARSLQDELQKAIKTLRSAPRLNATGNISSTGLTLAASQQIKSALDNGVQYETRLNEIFSRR